MRHHSFYNCNYTIPQIHKLNLNKMLTSNLSNALQDPDSNETVGVKASSDGSEESEHSSPQHTTSIQPLAPQSLCQPSTRNLGKDVAIEKGT